MQTRTRWLPSGREHYTGRSSFALLNTVRFTRRRAPSPLSLAGNLHPISNKEVLALAAERVEFLRGSDTACGKRVQTKKGGSSGFLPIAPLLTSAASEESRSSFLTNRVLPEHCRVSQRCPADDPGGQIRSGELLDEFILLSPIAI